MNRTEKRHTKKLVNKSARKEKIETSATHTQALQTLDIQQALNLAVQHHTAHQLQQAENIYQQILQAEPNQPDALHLLGVLAHQVGKPDVAVDLIMKAVTINPRYAEAHYNLGKGFREMGQLENAVKHYQLATDIEPYHIKAQNNLGNVFAELERLDKAISCFGKALAINPEFAEAHFNLGIALKNQGHLEEAIKHYEIAITLKPEYTEAHHNLGQAFLKQGLPEKAFNCWRRAVSINPNNETFWKNLEKSLESISFTSVDEYLSRDLLQLLERPAMGRPVRVIRPIISALRHHVDFATILELTSSGNPKSSISYSDAAKKLTEIPLFIHIMKLSPINDLKIERMLTSLRQAMLQDSMKGVMDEAGLTFAASMALQSFANEYIYIETPEETEKVNKLEQQIEEMLEKNLDIPPFIVITLAAYRPLYTLPLAQDLSEREWRNKNINEVIKRQLSEPFEEQSLSKQIPRLTSILDTVSQTVRKQYEENPYPRWIKISLKKEGQLIETVLQNFPLCYDAINSAPPIDPEILIAGCGTGLHSLSAATTFSNSKVLAIDLSLKSLSYAQRKTNELGVTNINYAQADIMELGNLERRFDLIESAGVLHHLGDPLAGWKVLEGLLRKGGLMHIGLYSKTAGKCITQARSLIAEKGYSSSLEGIRQCRQDLITMARDENQEMANLQNYVDFYSLSECRDLIFHVQEHRFTALQINDALRSLNLKFLGFEIRDQVIFEKFKAAYPGKDSQTSLTNWHEFEQKNPDTFNGMYQFWCQKI